MANVQLISGSAAVALTANSLDGVNGHSISGVAADHELNIIVSLNNASSTFSISAGGYPTQASGSLTQTLTTASGLYEIGNIDGSLYRQTDGTYDVTSNSSGSFYAFSRVY